MRARMGRLGVVAVAAIVQLAVLVLAHDLVYLARYGSRYGEALIHAGHGDGWRAAVASGLVLGGIAAVVAATRLLQLCVQVRRARAERADGRLELRHLLRTWLRIGPALALSTVALLTIQENLEQAASQGSSAGIAILFTPAYAGGLWIAFAVGLVVGAVLALVAWRLRVLEARLRTARVRQAHARAGAVGRPGLVVDRPITSILGRRSALRAPPLARPAS